MSDANNYQYYNDSHKPVSLRYPKENWSGNCWTDLPFLGFMFRGMTYLTLPRLVISANNEYPSIFVLGRQTRCTLGFGKPMGWEISEGLPMGFADS
jgi:hypothetical protein